MTNRPHNLLSCVGLVVVLAVGELARPDLAVCAELTSKTISRDGKALVVIANPFLELTFEPTRGGRCNSFRLLDNGEQIVGKDSGMFLDHWAKYAYPSGLMHLPYQYELVGDGKTRVGVRLWVKVPPMGGGKGGGTPESSARIPTSPELIGLVVRKTIWLNADSDVVVVEQEIHNLQTKSQAVAVYLQHALTMGGTSYHNNWYMPSSRGVVVNVQPDTKDNTAIGPDWVRDPTAGWMAVRDRQTDRAMVFAFDYDYLQTLYTSGSTAEWVMEPVPVGPNKNFRFTYVVKPVRGFKDFVYASRRIIADIRPDEVEGHVRVEHDIAATREPQSNVRVQFKVVGWKSKQAIAEKSFSLDKLGFEKAQQTFEFTTDRPADGVVIRAAVTADGRQECYEYYYAGDRQEHDRRYGWFATKGGALPSAKGDAYALKSPRKTKAIDKPDFSKIAARPADRFKCLVVYGLFTHVLCLDDALAERPLGGRQAVEFTWANCPPNAVETFPGTYDELFTHHAVVLSDVNYRALGDIAFEMIADYVEQGGSLLVVGGPYALGNGEFDDTRFPDVLPVHLTGPFDLKWAGKGRSWAFEPTAASHPVLKDVPLGDKTRVYWRHVVEPKSDAQVVLNAGGRPALILGRYGKGKVAVLTLSPTGMPANGETAWWDKPVWFPLVRNIFTWLAE